MRKGFLWLGCAGTLALGCGDDAVVTPQGSSGSGSAESSTGGSAATTVPLDTGSSAGVDDSEGGSTSSAGSSTSAMPESSTGPLDACGNGAIDGDEACDGTDLGGQDCAQQGYDAGTLACAADCSALDTRGCVHFDCGNDLVEGKEACDGADLGGATCQSEGFDSGTLACAADCNGFDTSECGTCGNVVVDGDEVCDGVVLLGQTCISQGFENGQLGCAAGCLAYDTTGCGTCGNDVIDGAEFCDGIALNGATCQGLGFDSGTLGCTASCSAFSTVGCGNCGNAMVDGDEVCDGPALAGQSCLTQGFDSGTLGCTPSCDALVTGGCGTCGNGLVDGTEPCDGVDLGGLSCASLGLSGGTLACTPGCQLDFSGCDIPGVPFGSDTGYNGFHIQGAPLACDDIAATGTPTLLTDDSNVVVPIGFSFPFYDVGYVNANVQSNGVLRFGDGAYLGFNNNCLPSGTNPSANNLYVFWDDLNPGAAGPSEVYYQTLGPVGNQRFVVQWQTAHFGGDTNDLIRVQAMLDEATGQITVCYPDTLSAANVGNNGAEATSGIQQSPVNGFDFSCNMPLLVNGTQLLYIPI